MSVSGVPEGLDTDPYWYLGEDHIWHASCDGRSWSSAPAEYVSTCTLEPEGSPAAMGRLHRRARRLGYSSIEEMRLCHPSGGGVPRPVDEVHSAEEIEAVRQRARTSVGAADHRRSADAIDARQAGEERRARAAAAPMRDRVSEHAESGPGFVNDMVPGGTGRLFTWPVGQPLPDGPPAVLPDSWIGLETGPPPSGEAGQERVWGSVFTRPEDWPSTSTSFTDVGVMSSDGVSYPVEGERPVRHARKQIGWELDPASWVGVCVCGAQTSRWPTAAAAQEALDEHVRTALAEDAGDWSENDLTRCLRERLKRTSNAYAERTEEFDRQVVRIRGLEEEVARLRVEAVRAAEVRTGLRKQLGSLGGIITKRTGERDSVRAKLAGLAGTAAYVFQVLATLPGVDADEIRAQTDAAMSKLRLALHGSGFGDQVGITVRVGDETVFEVRKPDRPPTDEPLHVEVEVDGPEPAGE